VLQQAPERRDVVHVRELRGAGEVPRTQPHGALDAELDVENGDARGCLRAEAHGARRGNLDAGLLLVVGALEEGLRASVPRVHACAEVAEVVRRLLDAHDAAERLDGDGELVTRAVGAHGRLPVHRAHVAGGHAMLVVAVQADVEEGPIVHALQGVGVGRRGHELVLPLLQLDGQGVAHDARLDLVHCCELEQGLLARGVQQLEAVDAGDARRPHGSLEHAAVHLDLFRALLRAADVLHAAARAIAALDGDLGLGLEAREVEVLLERRHAEVVDDVAHEARHARVVVRAVDEAAHEADLERHVGVGEGDEVLDEREAEQVHVRGEEDVEVHGGAPREQVLEEAQQLVAGRPRRHLGGALLDPEREVLHDVEHVVQVLHGDVLERGELQAVVLDERHAVLVHAEEDSLLFHRSISRRTMFPMSFMGARPGRCSILTTSRKKHWTARGRREAKSTMSSCSSFDVSARPDSCFSASSRSSMRAAISGATSGMLAGGAGLPAAEGAPRAGPSTAAWEKTPLGNSSGGEWMTPPPSPGAFAAAELSENPRSTRCAGGCAARRRCPSRRSSGCAGARRPAGACSAQGRRAAR
jgi:hypothetical protein